MDARTRQDQALRAMREVKLRAKEEKRQAVLRAAADPELDYATIGRRVGVNTSTARRWCIEAGLVRAAARWW